MSKPQKPMERPDQLHYYKSIDAYVLVPEPKYDKRSVKEILEDVREYAKWLQGETIETIPVHRAEPMTLRHYVPVFRESIVPPEIKSDDKLDHLFSQSEDPFYVFISNNVCVLDTQIEITEKRKRRLKNRFRKDEFFNVDVWEHGVPVKQNLKFPAPVKRKVFGTWEAYKAVVIERSLAEDVTVLTRDPEDFDKDNLRALTVTATDRCQIPKYSYINSMGAYDQGILWEWTKLDSSFVCSNMGVPIVIYTKEPTPYEVPLEQTTTRDTFHSFEKGIRDAARKSQKFLDKMM